MKAESNKCEIIVQLIEASREEEATGIIMDTCYDNLQRTLRRNYPNEKSFPDDLIHDATVMGIMALIKSIKSNKFICQNENSPCAFIAIVARRKLSKHWEKEKNNPQSSGIENIPHESVEQSGGKNIDIDIILANASPRCKELIILRIFKGLSFKEIGENLGITTANARVQYHNCIGKLRDTFNN